MILLNLFWIIFLSYWITVAKADTDRQMVDQRGQSSIATIGDLAFLLHDWLLTEKFLSASLMLPIVLEAIHAQKDIEELKQGVKLLYWVIKVSFYVILLAWLVTSLVKGGFIARESLTIVFFFNSVVFCWSLIRLQRHI